MLYYFIHNIGTEREKARSPYVTVKTSLEDEGRVYCG